LQKGEKSKQRVTALVTQVKKKSKKLFEFLFFQNFAIPAIRLLGGETMGRCFVMSKKNQIFCFYHLVCNTHQLVLLL